MKRIETTAVWALRIIPAALFVLTAWGPRAVQAQDQSLEFEVRAGALHSSPLAKTGVRLGPEQDFVSLGSMEIGGGVRPFVGAGVLLDLDYLVWLEAQTGFSWGTVEGEGPAGTWEAGNMVRFHTTGGLRVGLGRGLYVRGGLGFVVQSGSDLAVFSQGDDTGLLVAGAVGFQPVETLPLSLEVEAQRFDFGSTALRAAGAPDASIHRYFVGAAWRLGSGGER